MSTRKPRNTPATDHRARIATLFLQDKGAGTRLALTAGEVATRTATNPRTAANTLQVFVHNGWLGVRWQDADPYNFEVDRPCREFFVKDGMREPLDALVAQYAAYRHEVKNRVPRGRYGPRVSSVCAPPRPEDDEPLSNYRPVVKSARVKLRDDILRFFLRDPQKSLSTGTIAVALQASDSAVREHLLSLERAKLASSEIVSGSMPGRPRRCFTLTSAGWDAANAAARRLSNGE